MTQIFLIMGAFIFCCGVFGFLTRRNLILMFLSLELMLFGVSLNFVAFGNLHNDLGGQAFAVLILTIAACEAALALSLIVTLYRSRGSLDVNIWQSLRELDKSNTAELSTVMEFKNDDHDQAVGSYGDLPLLTPAGRDPLQYPVQESGERCTPAGLA